jgi:hypothetical protein
MWPTLVVVSNQVQRAMQQQHAQLVRQCVAALGCLAHRRVQRDHHVSQQLHW